MPHSGCLEQRGVEHGIQLDPTRAELRAPLEKEIRMTGIIALDIEHASAKISAKPYPEDEDADYDIPVWAGILPLQSNYTTLQDADRLIDGVAPSAAVTALQGKTF